MENEEVQNFSNEGLAKQLAKILGSTVVAQYTAHGYHWNVKGPEFTQFHAIFDSVYSDWTSTEDKLAEYIRTLGFDAPFTLGDFLNLSCCEARFAAGEPLEMTANLYELNMMLLGLYKDLFDVASALNNQGIANFAAERQDSHAKWNWQLGTMIGADATMIQSVNLGKSEAESPLNATTDVVVEVQPIQDYSSAISASGTRKIAFSKSTEDQLYQKAVEYNQSSTDKVAISQIKLVYRRGASDFSIGSIPNESLSSWASSRVDAFLTLLKNGAPKNPSYTQDYDLLPKEHPKALKTPTTGLTAAATAERDLYVSLLPESTYASPEEAIFSMAEFSGLGYETIPAFRAAWKRGVSNSESPFERAAMLAVDLYKSKDADLLPKLEEY
jgi:starvation-inducible DNA-binding protein